MLIARATHEPDARMAATRSSTRPAAARGSKRATEAGARSRTGKKSRGGGAPSGGRLLIVESPAKARTIGKYLDSDFTVLASYGHVRDLVPSRGAVEPERGFAMHFDLVPRAESHVEAIVRAMRRASALYLATDPDREGEAISWHVTQLLSERGVLQEKPVYRVQFHEITRRAVREALEHPGELQTNLVNSQLARRALDYLVGFNLSPVLWSKIRSNLSAGRVQSPALRLIADRESEIDAFETREYWTVLADAPGPPPFSARLVQYRGEKVEQFTFTDEGTAFAAQATLKLHSSRGLEVLSVTAKKRRRAPPAPFTTATLQQEASNRLGFNVSRTMRIAQELYEGVGGEGLITYMRTDSVNLAAEAVAEIRSLLADRFGPDAVPATPNRHRTRTRNAQEAHEAVRPTSPGWTPESLRATLSRDQFRVYELVWRRAMASQMKHAVMDDVTVDLGCGEGNVLRATGTSVASPGYLAVYEDAAAQPGGPADGQAGERKAADDGKPPSPVRLPKLSTGQVVTVSDIRAEQHFTRPPPRYTEATLVRELERCGIGRPSTYADIISKLQQRGYVELEKRRFHPTDVGRVVSRFLTEHFSRYVDFGFTASMEDDLDAISEGRKAWVPVLDEFWRDFEAQVRHKQETVTRQQVTQQLIDESCPECERPLAIRLGRSGNFISCTGFPECRYARNLPRGDEGEGGEEGVGGSDAKLLEDRQCPKCGGPLVVKSGRTGKFAGCSGYPECRHTEPLEKLRETDIACPACGDGTLRERRSRRGKPFFSCSTYPRCDYATWDEPLDEPCPGCGWPILTLKQTRRRGPEKACPQRECGHREPVAESSAALPEAG